MRWMKIRMEEVTYGDDGKEWIQQLGERTITIEDDEFEKVRQEIVDQIKHVIPE